MTAPYTCQPIPDHPGYWLFFEGVRCSSVPVAAGAGVGATDLTEARRELGELGEDAIATPPPPVPAPAPEPQAIQLSLF